MIKIASFNANSIRSRAPVILKWLAESAPDILCIQETKVQDKDFPLPVFAPAGYEIVFNGQKQYNGVAIFAKGQISKVTSGLNDEPKDPARLISAEINGISLVNTYIPQGHSPDSEKFQYKLQWFQRLRAYFDTHFSPDEPVVWLGDLNVALTEKDVYAPDKLYGSVCYCKQASDALTEVANWGFKDMFRKHCDLPGQYTFWDYRLRGGFKRNLGWRLDYIMATEPLAAKCTACWVDTKPRAWGKPSDHTFIIAEFDI